ncbi:MAG: aminotransferase class III-fold pyridoxal phosphate-dependent enzyme [Wenzhouxiangellaceae bacterium]|nr:aminotransferase class III-fold pyridoxal phosphate-dependent enzyme [Wenzhouxiangellaceae bacterium]
MNTLLPWLIALPVALLSIRWVVRRLRLSRAKHPSLRGHSRMAKRAARWIPRYELIGERFFAADAAPADVVDRRRTGFERLAERFSTRSPNSVERLGRLAERIPDLDFIGRYRVPFQFSSMVRKNLTSGVLVESSAGSTITDIDGNEFIDLTGAYGVKVFGTDHYKRWIAEGARRVEALGPVLGPYHPIIERNVEALKRISGLDAVSFHMSGTEAVMQAVRLARYHTGKSHIVRFCGAYHGWWDDVQPGIGNPATPGKVYTLAEMSDKTLKVLATRSNIACVLVNPLQALHPNANAPGDGALIAAERSASFDRQAYSDWLKRLRAICSQAGIVLIFDEIFVGFRIAARGAQEYFGVQADLVTYGKTLGGGLPVGVLCGRAELMKRYRDDRPVDICFARGTFNSHPYVLGAMAAFLDHYESGPVQGIYETLEADWEARAARFNAALEKAGLPLRIAKLSSIFTVLYDAPSRYNWMLQFYLNAEGILLPWTGTGRLIFPIAPDGVMFDEVIQRFVRAGHAMQADGWWWHPPGADNRSVKREILRETLRARLLRGAST